MTTDQLIQFAASKVGKPTMEFAGVCYIVDGTLHGQSVLIGVNSPDLMLKGMEVCSKDHLVEIQLYRHDGICCGQVLIDREDPLRVYVNSPTGLPVDFWTTWYRLEKGAE